MTLPADDEVVQHGQGREILGLLIEHADPFGGSRGRIAEIHLTTIQQDRPSLRLR